MRTTILLLAALVVGAVSAATTECCYQFSPQLSIPRLTWDLGPTPITPVLTLQQRLTSADSSAAVGDCSVLGAEVFNVEQQMWLAVDRAHVQRFVTVTNSQMELGPLTPGTDDRNYLIANLHGKTVRLSLSCADFPRAPSCVLFDLMVRDSTDVSGVSLLLDTASPRSPCARSASPTSSLSPSITRTPSQTPSQTPTAAPSYGNMYRWRLQAAATGARLDLEMAFNADDVQACQGKLRLGTGEVLLEPADSAHSWSAQARRGVKASEYYKEQATAATRQTVSLVWANGGYCRFGVYMDGTRPAEVDACRVYDDANTEHRFAGPAAGEPLDYRSHKLCVGDPSPSPTPEPSRHAGSASASARPLSCVGGPALAGFYRATRDRDSIIELKLRAFTCSDSTTRYSLACATRLHVVGNPDAMRQPQFDAPNAQGLVTRVSWDSSLWLDVTTVGAAAQLTISDAAFQLSPASIADSLSMIWPCETP
jgi:hypothetical protein